VIGLSITSASSQPHETSWPHWLQDHAVLPAHQPIPLRGFAPANLPLAFEYAGHTAAALPDDTGAWQVRLPPMKPGTKGTLTCRSGTNLVLTAHDVTVGEVWLCAGQSNMAMSVRETAEAEDLRALGAERTIRRWTGTEWKIVTPAAADGISAIAWALAAERAQAGGDQPIGLLVAARGGTSIDAWMPPAFFPETPRAARLRTLVDDPDVRAAADEDARDFRPYGEHRLARWGLARAAPAALHRELLEPLADIPLTGVAWYQGESDADSVEQAEEYDLWLSRLVDALRDGFQRPDLPIVVLQLPHYAAPNQTAQRAWQLVREAQARVVRDTPHTAIADLFDLGEPGDIHPRRKLEAGRRAAEAAARVVNQPGGRLHRVTNWVFHLTNYRRQRLDELMEGGFDLAVIDLTRDGGEDYFTRGEIGALQARGCLALAYFAIGSIETYRPEWNAVPAALKSAKVEGWPDEYFVKFWAEDWWPVVRGRIDRALAAGFDGAYLDLITAYEEIPLEAAEPGVTREDLARRMVALIERISRYAKAHDPDFLVVPQNCPELYTWSYWSGTPNDAYLDAVDGIGLESVFYIAHDKPADADWCRENRDNAHALHKAGKVVLGVDYATRPEVIRDAYQSMRSIGFVPYVSVRNLDRVVPEAVAVRRGIPLKERP